MHLPCSAPSLYVNGECSHHVLSVVAATIVISQCQIINRQRLSRVNKMILIEEIIVMVCIQFIQCIMSYYSFSALKYSTVEPPLTDTSRKRQPLLSGHFFWSRGCPLMGGLTVHTNIANQTFVHDYRLNYLKYWKKWTSGRNPTELACTVNPRISTPPRISAPFK